MAEPNLFTAQINILQKEELRKDFIYEDKISLSLSFPPLSKCSCVIYLLASMNTNHVTDKCSITQVINQIFSSYSKQVQLIKSELQMMSPNSNQENQ